MVVDPFCSIFIPISGLFSGDVIIRAEPDSGTDFESGFSRFRTDVLDGWTLSLSLPQCLSW